VRIVAEFTALLFERMNSTQGAGDGTMLEKAAEKNYRSGLIDHDDELKQALESLARENSHLKQLVVRLSETVLRNVTSKF
jgi:hypothetical protein